MRRPPKFGEWISVNDKLPPLGEVVLVCEEGIVSTLALRIKEQFPCPYPSNQSIECEVWTVKSNGGGWEYEPNDCTPDHWMRLPSPPKGNL
jgi:hypothetical protein